MTELKTFGRRTAAAGLLGAGLLCIVARAQESPTLAPGSTAPAPGNLSTPESQPTPESRAIDAALPPEPKPTSEAIRAYQRTLPAHVAMAQAVSGPLPLSLDQAISLGLHQSVQIELSNQNQTRVRGLTSTAVNALLPSLEAQAYTNTQEINLAAMGFKPQSLGPLLSQFGLASGSFSSIVKVDVTSAQLNLNQTIFNVPAYFLYRAAQKAATVAEKETLNVRGGVALAVGQQYLMVLADAAQVENDKAQVQSDQAAFAQARERQEAGVGVHLDTLRAQVQLQAEQQTLINAENTYGKDKIQLNRLMGSPADQDYALTDTTPYEELARLSQNMTLDYAYTKRKDLLSLEAQIEVARQTQRAAHYERLPTVALGGYYGVLGETHGLYHGVFTAQGSVNFPIFKEAQFRGEEEVAGAQLMALRRQVDSLRVTIDQQIRAALLDVQSSDDLVKVARSNVELSRQELADSQERFKAGVTDNLPLVEAQASLAAAESQLVQRLFAYNVAKLQLARSVGVVETEYKSYLGR